MKRAAFYLMAVLYIAAGINHFVHPDGYLKIMPPWLGWPAGWVVLSGVAETVCGLLLLPRPTRRLGAWCTIALLIAVFPANIQMTINYMHDHNPLTWATIVRLPLQVLLIWWAYQYTKPAALLL